MSSKSTKSSSSPAKVDVAGLKIISVRTADVRPNPFNPNRQSPEIFEREKRSIVRHGFIDPISIREAPGGWLEIVDGEHRWKAATELGITELPAVHLGKLSDDDAKRLVILFNELRGEPDPVLLAAVLKDLTAQVSPADLALDLPITVAEIDTLVKASQFNWDSLNQSPPGQAKHEANPFKTGAEERTFVLGGLKGYITIALHDRLMAQFKLASDAAGSKNLELVLDKMCARLEASVAPTLVQPLEEASDGSHQEA